MYTLTRKNVLSSALSYLLNHSNRSRDAVGSIFFWRIVKKMARWPISEKTWFVPVACSDSRTGDSKVCLCRDEKSRV